MIARRLLLTVLGGLVLAATAEAQPAGDDGGTFGTRRGSLTILSQPRGAVFRLEGTQIELTGRTPWSIARGLEGIYTLRAENSGYESWSQTVYLDPTSQDTLRIQLTPKTRFRALARSIVVPGWGQTYTDQRGKGVAFFLTTAAAGVTALVLDDRYDDQVDDLELAFDAYEDENEAAVKAELWKVVQRELKTAEDYDRDRDIAVAITGALYAANLLDAFFLFPKRGTSLFAATPDGRGLYAAMSPRQTNVGLRWTF